MSKEDATAHLQVLRGKPSAEQLAAVIAALRVVLSREEDDAQASRSFWGTPQMRTTLPHGRGMWTHSLRNR